MPPGENGQQTHTHLSVPAVTATIAVLVVPTTVPASPAPVSPLVWCHMFGPSSNDALSGAAVSVMFPVVVMATVCIAAVEAVPPLTVMLHHGVALGAFFTVRCAMALPEPGASMNTLASIIFGESLPHATASAAAEESKIASVFIIGLSPFP